nr:hypothetical protein [Rhodococcus wratislaviensis]
MPAHSSVYTHGVDAAAVRADRAVREVVTAPAGVRVFRVRWRERMVAGAGARRGR